MRRGQFNSAQFAAESFRPVRTGCAGWPSARANHTMVWTGSLAEVWGGDSGTGLSKVSGGRFDPATDAWAPMTIRFGVPVYRTGHTAVWTGQYMMVWGGNHGGVRMHNGGRYIVAPAIDHDGDGVMVCEGDCDDTSAGAWSRRARSVI